MQATGIIRRIDDLGRIVIPKEIHRNLGISEGTPMEMFVDDNRVIFQKYIATGNLRERLQDLTKAFYDCRADLDKESAGEIEERIKALATALEER